MSEPTRPQVYRPVFGNDNFYAPDTVDIAAFTSPVAKRKDAAAASAKKSEK